MKKAQIFNFLLIFSFFTSTFCSLKEQMNNLDSRRHSFYKTYFNYNQNPFELKESITAGMNKILLLKNQPENDDFWTQIISGSDYPFEKENKNLNENILKEKMTKFIDKTFKTITDLEIYPIIIEQITPKEINKFKEIYFQDLKTIAIEMQRLINLELICQMDDILKKKSLQAIAKFPTSLVNDVYSMVMAKIKIFTDRYNVNVDDMISVFVRQMNSIGNGMQTKELKNINDFIHFAQNAVGYIMMEMKYLLTSTAFGEYKDVETLIDNFGFLLRLVNELSPVSEKKAFENLFKYYRNAKIDAKKIGFEGVHDFLKTINSLFASFIFGLEMNGNEEISFNFVKKYFEMDDGFEKSDVHCQNIIKNSNPDTFPNLSRDKTKKIGVKIAQTLDIINSCGFKNIEADWWSHVVSNIELITGKGDIFMERLRKVRPIFEKSIVDLTFINKYEKRLYEITLDFVSNLENEHFLDSIGCQFEDYVDRSFGVDKGLSIYYPVFKIQIRTFLPCDRKKDILFVDFESNNEIFESIMNMLKKDAYKSVRNMYLKAFLKVNNKKEEDELIDDKIVLSFFSNKKFPISVFEIEKIVQAEKTKLISDKCEDITSKRIIV